MVAVDGHPAERETDGDVDHRSHDIDLRLGQVRRPFLLTFDLRMTS